MEWSGLQFSQLHRHLRKSFVFIVSVSGKNVYYNIQIIISN